MKLNEAFEALKNAHGSHVKAAEVLNITPRHYRHLRSNPDSIPQRTADLILLRAREVTPEEGLESTREAA